MKKFEEHYGIARAKQDASAKQRAEEEAARAPPPPKKEEPKIIEIDDEAADAKADEALIAEEDRSKEDSGDEDDTTGESKGKLKPNAGNGANLVSSWAAAAAAALVVGVFTACYAPHILLARRTLDPFVSDLNQDLPRTCIL
jgi:hypothetical protein